MSRFDQGACEDTSTKRHLGGAAEIAWRLEAVDDRLARHPRSRARECFHAWLGSCVRVEFVVSSLPAGVCSGDRPGASDCMTVAKVTKFGILYLHTCGEGIPGPACNRSRLLSPRTCDQLV